MDAQKKTANHVNRSLGSKQITVIVGQGETARNFYVHETLLTQHSDFFVAALKNEWKEAGERTVRLPDDIPEIFTIFARFTYYGKICSRLEGDKTSEKNDNEWTRLRKCWVLGDKLASTNFKDAVCDAMCEKMKIEERFPTGVHERLYPSSATPTCARRLIVDIATYKWGSTTIGDRTMHESWNEFFRDLAVNLRTVSEQQRKSTPPFDNPECKYHEHVAAKTPCYKTMF